MSDKIVYIVHCVDTEGPLYESLPATFERLQKAFGIVLKPTVENLLKLRKGDKTIPENIRSLVAEFVSEKRLNYKKDWAEVNEMVDEIISPEWRHRYMDDFGEGYKFNWFVLDHVGFEINPRRRSIGYHALFEHYKEKLESAGCLRDEIHWHFHPVSFFKEAHKSSNNYSFTSEHLQILSRRVIDHLWFPAAFRPGLHCERPDINLFLEQWIPFDYGNQGMEEARDQGALQKDLANGRYGDWRRATTEWEVYHPDFYDYQLQGTMKRYIARCLNLNARLRAIDEYEIEKAFERADTGKKTIMAVTNHDEREMRPDVDKFFTMVKSIQKKYPAVKIKNSGAVEAMRESLNLKRESPVQFKIRFNKNTLIVETDKAPWGCQPYFCFKTKAQQYIHENLDYHGGTLWSFTFDEDTILFDQLEAIGLAANDAYGNTSAAKINSDDGSIVFRNNE